MRLRSGSLADGGLAVEEDLGRQTALGAVARVDTLAVGEVGDLEAAVEVSRRPSIRATPVSAMRGHTRTNRSHPL